MSNQINLSEIPGEFTNYPVFIPETPETFEYDAGGNLTLDGIWVYEWDGENRLKAMWMRPDVAAVRLGAGDWVRLEFVYDWMGRRISKKYLKGEGDTSWSIEKATESMLWGAQQHGKFVWDGWTPSLSYRCDVSDGAFLGLGQSQAWGPDLSGSPQGAGGIGGLAIRVDEHWDATNGGGAIGPMFPMYDGNGNVTRVYAALQNMEEVPQARYEFGPFGEIRSIFGINGQSHRNPWRWSTKYTDAETGLVYYGYRYYSAGLGRWLSRDPLAEGAAAGIFAFVSNRPTHLVDPVGLADYKKGKDDPPITFDAGAGQWDVDIPTQQNQIHHNTLKNWVGQTARQELGWTDAADHLAHYLDNSGADYTIRLQNMIDTVPSAKIAYEREKNEAMDFVETLSQGSFDITSQSAPGGYNGQSENGNWFFAVGGYASWGKGKATIQCPAGSEAQYTLRFKYKFADRYNWDNGKSVTVAGVTITDKFMGTLHRVGLAREFNMYGEVEETITWTKRTRVRPVPTPVPPAAPPKKPRRI